MYVVAGSVFFSVFPLSNNLRLLVVSLHDLYSFWISQFFLKKEKNTVHEICSRGQGLLNSSDSMPDNLLQLPHHHSASTVGAGRGIPNLFCLVPAFDNDFLRDLLWELSFHEKELV